MRPSYRSVPGNPTGAPLNPCREWVGIIVPEATTNLLLNPSWELNTSNWTDSSTGSSGTPYARSTAAQCRGAYAAVLTVRPTNGTYVQIVAAAVTVGTLYTISFHVKRPGKGRVKAGDVRAFVNNVAVEFDKIAYVGDGWWRCVKTFQATVTNAPGIRVLGSPGAIFYVDAAQLEAKGYETTYCDGDQLGLLPVEPYPPFIWNGTPHASTSSRSALTRAGGREMNLGRYGFTLIALMGLAMSTRAVIATPLGLLDGSLYQRSIRESRAVTLAGAFEADNPLALSRQRSSLYSALQSDLTGVDQPVMLTVQRHEGSTATGAQGLIVGSYTDGLEGNEETIYSEKAAMHFTQWLPMLIGATSIGGTISPQSSVSNANYIVQRSITGAWSALATGPGGSVSSLAVGLDGTLYVGASAWNGSAWSTLGTGLNGAAYATVIGPDGSLYVGGSFTTAGGGAANRVAKWNGSAWSALGTGLGGDVYALAFAANGDLYVGGDFVTAGGGAANYIAKWNGSAWSAVGAGLNDIVFALAMADDGTTLYVGGGFTEVSGGITVNHVAKWNGSAWSAMGQGMDPFPAVVFVRALAIGPDGMVYAGGDFTEADGNTAAAVVAQWNGSGWSAMPGNQLTTAYSLGFDTVGQLYVGGVISGSLFPDGVQVWNGSAWTPAPINLPGTAIVQAVLSYNGTLYIGYNTSGTATAPGTASITNTGQAASFQIKITGPTSGAAKRIYSLLNTTTRDALYFDVTLLVGEMATITINGGAIEFTTNFRGSLPGAITSASSAQFRFVNGSNTLSLLTEDSTMTATYAIIPQYDGLDGLTGR